ncbi:MAG: hypothetical protein NC408_05345 [Candidatus Gastranaerophilales bacterium]|nr:hypothetical protein [Candidatus Gastranaerophilales bacterium]MCM1072885.1 hypothetical protein [Bacteroides sp.]
MADITSSQIFLFLAKQDDWKTKVDKNKDYEITKGEMREYLSGSDFENYIGMGIDDVSAKVFNEFWAKLDNNVSDYKLDETEEGKLDSTVANYQKLEELISKNAPNGTVNTKYMGTWEARIAELLLEKVESGEQSIDDVIADTSAFIVAYNKATAEVLAEQYKNDDTSIKSILSSAGIDYEITKDETLNNVINKYIEDVVSKFTYSTDENGQPNFTPADINKQIKNLINSYLKTAGLGDGGTIDVSKYGYNPETLNEVQNAVVLKKVSDKLSGEKSKFAGYENEFNGVLNSFLANYLESSGITAEGGKSLFDTIVGKLDQIKSAFTSSKEYKNLETTMNVYKKYRDNLDDTFKTAVKDALGDDADIFLNNCKTSKDYATILQGIIDRINSGDENLMSNGAVDWTKVQAAVVEEVTSLIKGAATGTGALDSLYSDYERNSSDIEKAREKAIKYCDAAKAMGGEYDAAVVKVFGSDHKATIEGIEDTIQLASKMNTLKGLIAKITAGQDLDSKINNWIGASPRTMIAGMSGSFQVQASLSEDMDPSEISYGAASSKCGKLTMTNASNGKFNYTAPAECGYDKITVTTYYKGEPIGSTTITVNVAEVSRWINDPSGGHLEVHGTNGAVADDSQVNATDFATLYNSNAVINLARGTKDCNSTNKMHNGDGRLDNLIDMIKQSLRGGLDSAKLDKACDIVATKYKKNIVQMGQVKDNKDGAAFSKAAAKRIQAADYHGICYQYDKEGVDSYVCMVSFKNLVDDILAEYSKL